MSYYKPIAAFSLTVLLIVGCQHEPKIAVDQEGDGAAHAVAFKGQTYRTRTGRSAITLVSSEELEYTDGGTTLLCKYSEQDGALRVIMTALGTQQVLYFKRVNGGLQGNDGELFYDQAGMAELQRQEELARRQQEEARAAAERDRAEAERLARESAQREAEAKRLAEERENKESERLLRAFLPSRPTLYTTWHDQFGSSVYNVRKMMLKITSFDPQTGAVTGESDRVDNLQKAGNVTDSVVGDVSGGYLNLTIKMSNSSARLRLRYDAAGPKLVGDFGNSERFFRPIVYTLE